MDVEKFDNPMGTDGFAFVEFSSQDKVKLSEQFKALGFTEVSRHKHKDIHIFKQGDIVFILNAQPNSQAESFNKRHGPSANAMGFFVADPLKVIKHAKAIDYDIFENDSQKSLPLPALKGVGGSLLYLTTRQQFNAFLTQEFTAIKAEQNNDAGLTYIDHLTHNVFRGNMNKLADFYQNLFNFREIRYFDIKGKLTGLVSRAMTSACQKIRIPINESTDDKSQIEEYLHQFNGEGIQHIALGTDDIYRTVATLKQQGIGFLTTPDTYYEKIDTRLPGHGENVDLLHQQQILIDGSVDKNEKRLLLQIFTENMLGPVFFEIIQRKGDEGFGEGNFQALFESIEEDQIRRGVLAKENKS